MKHAPAYKELPEPRLSVLRPNRLDLNTSLLQEWAKWCYALIQSIFASSCFPIVRFEPAVLKSFSRPRAQLKLKGR